MEEQTSPVTHVNVTVHDVAHEIWYVVLVRREDGSSTERRFSTADAASVAAEKIIERVMHDDPSHIRRFIQRWL